MSRKLLTIIAAAAIVLTGMTAQARNINVRGKVTIEGTGEPAYGVGIYNATTDKLIATTKDAIR